MADNEINKELLSDIVTFSYQEFKKRSQNPTTTKEKVITHIAKHMKEVLKNEDQVY